MDKPPAAHSWIVFYSIPDAKFMADRSPVRAGTVPLPGLRGIREDDARLTAYILNDVTYPSHRASLTLLLANLYGDGPARGLADFDALRDAMGLATVRDTEQEGPTDNQASQQDVQV